MDDLINGLIMGALILTLESEGVDDEEIYKIAKKYRDEISQYRSLGDFVQTNEEFWRGHF